MHFSVGRVSGLCGYVVGFAPKALRENNNRTIRTFCALFLSVHVVSARWPLFFGHEAMRVRASVVKSADQAWREGARSSGQGRSKWREMHYPEDS